MASPEPTTPRLPAVDVVVATRNRPELLREALESIRAQTYRGDITVHVVFDQSPIDPAVLLDEPGRRVVALDNDRSPGLAGARNAGILHGDAELVAFCDDDDAWRPTKVEKQVSALVGSTALTAVTGITVLYADSAVDRVPDPSDMTLEQLVRDRVMEAHPSTVMVRRDALLGEIGLVDEVLPGSYGEDFDWIIRAAQAGTFAVVAEPLVLVRWGQSMFSQRWRTIVDAIDYMIDKHSVFAEDPRAMARLLGRSGFALAALGERREAVRRAWRAIRLNPRERRALLVLAVATRAVSAERLMRIAHKRGHGI
ncbi:glycosyltransferase family 2 protein [Nocardioides aequoreus]|uniref:glycosyltransferase family 2 protein n=1 Tax=Nocardioides aequoreus TaxID=397278 RepID=UPI0004C330B5|nr:glycosyltransferase family A protein [Nocardioides aequoreus]